MEKYLNGLIQMPVEPVDVENPFLYNGDSQEGRGLGESQSKRENLLIVALIILDWDRG